MVVGEKDEKGCERVWSERILYSYASVEASLSSFPFHTTSQSFNDVSLYHSLVMGNTASTAVGASRVPIGLGNLLGEVDAELQYDKR